MPRLRVRVYCSIAVSPPLHRNERPSSYNGSIFAHSRDASCLCLVVVIDIVGMRTSMHAHTPDAAATSKAADAAWIAERVQRRGAALTAGAFR